MELVNASQLVPAWLVGKITPSSYSVTCIVKGTFHLSPGGIARLAEEQLYPTGDEYRDKNPEHSLRYPSDFVYLKTRADLLLVGTCYPPNGRPVGSVPATFQVGRFSKTLAVIGDRQWDTLRGQTDPQPFMRMPMTYEHAYGGAGYVKNPLGKGFTDIATSESMVVRPFPNIETPGHLLVEPYQNTEPAGFAPIPQAWPQRMAKVGTFNEQWLKTRWPWYPEDFDWSFFNAAPQDQQVEGYLKGDEELYCKNLHPTYAQYRCQLPGLRVRCFLNERVKASPVIREVPMVLDTLWADMDAEQLILVWHGNAPVRSEKLLEVYHLLVVAESLTDPLHPAEHYREVLAATLLREAQEDDELEPEEPVEVEEESEAEPEETLEAEEEPGEEEALEEEEPEAVAAEKAEIENKKESIQPDVTQTPEEEVEEARMALLQMKEKLQVMGKPFPESLEARLQALSVVPEDAEQEESDPELELPPEESEPLTQEQILERIRLKQSLEGEDLSEMVLTEMDLEGMNLRHAILQNVTLSRSILNGVDLSGASLGGADLREAVCQGANFAEADLTEALLGGADLANAILDRADLSKAKLRGAQLTNIQGEGIILAEADLSDANLEGAQLVGADLTDCRVHRTNFSQADLTSASLENAWGRHVIAEGATLTKLKAAGAIFSEGNFKRSLAEGSIWEGGQLYACDFSDARLVEAEFSFAYLSSAIFNGADLREACLDEATLRNTTMRRTNLLEASVQKADLTQADLHESNLYEANLCFSELTDINFQGANRRLMKHTMEEV